SDQMQRYIRWRDEGYMSSTGHCFDIGNTVSQALERFVITGNPLSGSEHERSAGNGSLMRLAPVPMYYYPEPQDIVEYAGESSRTTHGAAECVESCRLLGLLLFKAFEGNTKNEILFNNHEFNCQCSTVASIATGEYRDKLQEDVRGTGYVIDSLEAALWSFYTTNNFKTAILKAANLGDDADTTAAICGQIAGAYYGIDEIPADWIDKLAMRETIMQLSIALLERKRHQA
ncbi:MAG: ADP-ribosylglycohydrolase family protein, partial [Gammaproteobacteria bacterium]